MENIVFTTAAFTEQASATENPGGGDTEHAGRQTDRQA